MATQPKPRLTPEQYLEIERKAEHKSEYLDGEMYAMSGGSASHCLIAMNIGRQLGNQLEDRPCAVFNSDLRVLAESTGLYCYPDVSVVCGEPRLLDGGNDTLLNPSVIIEVLSPSTEGYDRGVKFEHYQAIPSLREYVLVASTRQHMDLFTREPDGTWRLSVAAAAGDKLTLTSINCTLTMEQVYAKVDLSQA
jgi:Uma2 family endonuclease